MPAPTPLPLRKAIWHRHHNGQTPATIAHDLGLRLRTVQQLLRRGRGAIAPSYQRCGRPRDDDRQQLCQEAIALRRQHPTWGAGYLRIQLRRRHPDARLPTERTLQRCLRQAGLGPAPKGRRPTANGQRAGQPHEVWQMDAAEQVPLASGQRVSWLRIVDEGSGAVLWTKVFPPGELVDGPAHRGPGRVA